MPIRHAIWKVSQTPASLDQASLANEELLREMIIASPTILSDELLIIGRQVQTKHGGFIDLLAVGPDGSLVIIELKRDRTPREVIAQALDYASWVKFLQADEIAAIYAKFAPSKDLATEFKTRFGVDLDEETLNEAHQIIVAASSLDPSSERIVQYLSDFDIPINILFFQIFQNGNEQLLSRTWLLDPIETLPSAPDKIRGPKEPWNGEFYFSFGHDHSRSWTDAVEYGFVCAGGGSWYSSKLGLLKAGDRIWVKAPGYGYVGVGRVTGERQAAKDFRVVTDQGERLVLDVAKGGNYHREFINDSEKSEYFLPVNWVQTVPLEQAIDEIGLFGNQNTVCKPKTPKWRHTVERLMLKFPRFDRRI